jgi:hypothetical protein
MLDRPGQVRSNAKSDEIREIARPSWADLSRLVWTQHPDQEILTGGGWWRFDGVARRGLNPLPPIAAGGGE